MRKFESRPRVESLGKFRFYMQRLNPAAPTGESVSNAYGIGSRSKCHEMRRFVSSAERVGKYLVQLATRLSQPVSPSGSSARRRQCIARLQATSPRGVRACIRRVAGCATSTSFASHASTEAGLELTLHLDHPMGSHQLLNLKCSLRVLACTRFRRHRVRCFDGAGGGSWRDGSLRGSSSLRRCA